jgi:alcohol/geraniol dehydrogenase (NADP+)
MPRDGGRELRTERDPGAITMQHENTSSNHQVSSAGTEPSHRSVVRAWAAPQAKSPLQLQHLVLAPLGEHDVEIAVSHCGVCGSDIHLVDDDWGTSQYPVVPGHEIVGIVRARGSSVKDLPVGTRVGVGWQSSSCGRCSACESGHENLCRRQERTCVGRNGGFAERVRVDARFVHPLPASIPSEHAAPLLCAGATVYAPLRRFGVGEGSQVAILGLGGLGHLGVQFARALGAEVTVFTRSDDKEAYARELGASRVVRSDDRAVVKGERGRHDLILSTVHADLHWSSIVQALAPGGTLCFLGIPSERLSLPIGLLVEGQRSVCGSVVASPAVMREMLELAARERVTPLVESMAMDQAEQGLQRVRDGLARFRVVLSVQ